VTPDAPAPATPAEPAPTPAPARRKARAAPAEPKASDAAPPAEKKPARPAKAEKEEAPAPKRAPLTPARRRLLALRRTLDGRRPIFGRQAANRYYRIGRDGSWRRPRGLQSKQRRHYGYRAEIVSIGYRSPAAVRGLVPSGYAPVLVHNRGQLDGLDGTRQAAIIGRTVGTRLRLVLEEAARKRGIRVLNPLVKAEREA
jgi:large subunit ribosomal protein L32e